MPQQDFSVDFLHRPRQQVVKDRASGLTMKVYDNGTQVVVTSCTITIKKPGGGDLATPVVAATAQVDGSGTCTYTVAVGNTAELGANYVAHWFPLKSGTVMVHYLQTFDIVRFPLTNVVTTADLVLHRPDLANYYFSGETTAQTYIEQAFEDVFQFIDSKGKRPWLVLSSEDLRRPIEHAALAKFFLARVKQEGDRWHLSHQHHEKQFAAWMSSANFVYDENNSATADGTDIESGGSGEEGESFGMRFKV